MAVISKIITSLFFCFILMCSLFTPLEATFILRYSNTDNGALSFTGNTLGLCKLNNQYEPGLNDSIGAFITTDSSQQVGSFPTGTAIPPGVPAGTTISYTSNSSQAQLDLPAGSTVLYAELVWSGGYGWDPSMTPAFINTVSVSLTTPMAMTFSVSPDPATAQEAETPGFPGKGNYVRSQDVTSIIQTGGAGTYIVGGVPASLVINDETHNCAGWTLAVAYSNPLSPTQNLTIFVGCEQASNSETPAEVNGFCVPPTGAVSGRLFMSATEGDANKTGDHMLFGPTSSLTILADSIFGINNPINNFFCSQVNTLVPLVNDPMTGKLMPQFDSGLLDIRGSYGTRNSDPFTVTNFFAGRQGWDITSVDISNKLTNGQQVAYAQGTTTSDDYTLNCLGIQIIVEAPIIVATKLVDSELSITSNVGDTVTFSFTVENIGASIAYDVIFKDVLETGLSYVPGTFRINNVLQPDPNLTLGVLLGDIPPMAPIIRIEFKAHIDAFPLVGNTYFDSAILDYLFIPCQSTVPISLTAGSNEVSINFLEPPIVVNVTIDKCKTLNKSTYLITARWTPSRSPTVIAYLIFERGKLVAVVPANGPLVFKTCLKSKLNAHDFEIVAVDAGDNQSVLMPIYPRVKL